MENIDKEKIKLEIKKLKNNISDLENKLKENENKLNYNHLINLLGNIPFSEFCNEMLSYDTEYDIIFDFNVTKNLNKYENFGFHVHTSHYNLFSNILTKHDIDYSFNKCFNHSVFNNCKYISIPFKSRECVKKIIEIFCLDYDFISKKISNNKYLSFDFNKIEEQKQYIIDAFNLDFE